MLPSPLRTRKTWRGRITDQSLWPAGANPEAPGAPAAGDQVCVTQLVLRWEALAAELFWTWSCARLERVTEGSRCCVRRTVIPPSSWRMALKKKETGFALRSSCLLGPCPEPALRDTARAPFLQLASPALPRTPGSQLGSSGSHGGLPAWSSRSSLTLNVLGRSSCWGTPCFRPSH